MSQEQQAAWAKRDKRVDFLAQVRGREGGRGEGGGHESNQCYSNITCVTMCSSTVNVYIQTTTIPASPRSILKTNSQFEEDAAPQRQTTPTVRHAHFNVP